MKYKALVLDIDGTLVVHGEPYARPGVVKAVKEAQRQGLAIVIATGRTYFAMSKEILGGIHPDFAICANGAQVIDRDGKLLTNRPFTPEEMYALVDYFEDFDYPLAFCFQDNYYVYVETKKMQEFYKTATGHDEYVLDGEDQVRHLQDMPFGAFGIIPAEKLPDFQERYGYLGLQFAGYRPGYYDIMQKGTDKARGLSDLIEKEGWKAEEIIAIGDSENDVSMLKFAGLSYCMANGCEASKQAADRIAPDVTEEGVAAAIREVLRDEL